MRRLNRVIFQVIAQNPGRVIIDCNGKDVDALHPFGSDDHHDLGIEQHGSISFRDVGIVRCSGLIRWDSYESHENDRLFFKVLLIQRSQLFMMKSICSFAPHRLGQTDALRAYSAGKSFSSYVEDVEAPEFTFCHQSHLARNTSWNRLMREELIPEILGGTAISDVFTGTSRSFEANNIAPGVTGRRLLQSRSSHDQTMPNAEKDVEISVLSHELNANVPKRTTEDSTKGHYSLSLEKNIAHVLLAHYTSHGRPPYIEDEDGQTRFLLTAEHGSRRRFQGSRA